MPDYRAKARALRAKAADPVVPDPERQALLAKAAELEAKHPAPSNGNFGFTVQDTTITSRDGRFYNDDYWRNVPRPQTVDPEAAKYWAEYLTRLAENQWRWNPPPDYEEDIVEEQYRYDEDEDYGYEEFN